MSRPMTTALGLRSPQGRWREARRIHARAPHALLPSVGRLKNELHPVICVTRRSRSEGLVPPIQAMRTGNRLAMSVRGDFQARVELELLEDDVHMALDRVHRDVKPLRDFL